MAMSKTRLAGVFRQMFKAMLDPASENPKGDAWYAEQLAAAIIDEVQQADVLTGIAVQGVCPDGAVTGQTTSLGVIR
jgi:hypothetical protein